MKARTFDGRRVIRAAGLLRAACAIEALESRRLLAGSLTPITVGNPSFESAAGADGSAIGVAVWNLSGTVGNAFNPTSSNYTNASDNSTTAGALGAPGDQKQVLFIIGANTATQTLATTLAANTTYTLTVAVGNRGDLVMENFGIAVLAGGTTIASTTGDGETAPSFGFQDFSATSLAVPAASKLVGQPLTIQLSCLGTKAMGGQVNFDNVRLSSMTQSGPTASLPTQAPAPLVGDKLFTVNVDYTGSSPIDASTLGNDDIFITGPNGFKQVGTLSGPAGPNANSVAASYKINVAAGLFPATSDGTYTVTMLDASNQQLAGIPANQSSGVADVTGIPVPAGVIGTFHLAVQGPVLELSNAAYNPGTYVAGGSIGFNATVSNQGNAPASPFTLSVGLIPAAGNGAGLIILGTTTVSQNLAPGASIVHLNVPEAVIGATTPADSYFVYAQISYNVAGAVRNPNDSFSATSPDVVVKVAPPMASLPQQPASFAGAKTFTVNLDYAGSVPIDTSTLGNDDILVTGPSGYAAVGQFVGPNGPNANSVQASYILNAPGGSLKPSADGIYTVTMLDPSNQQSAGIPATQPSGVADVNGITVGPGVIGQFVLTVQASPSLAPLQLTNSAFTPGTYNAGGTVAFSATISNQGDTTVGSFTLAVGLSQDTGFTNGNIVLLATATVNQGLAPGQSVSVNVPGAVIPAGTADGRYFVGAQINSNVAGAVHGSSDTFQSGNPDIVVTTPPPPPPRVTIGGLDTSFGTGGIVRQSTPLRTTTAVTVQADGKTVAVGQNGGGTPDFCITRFNSNGSLDTTFGQTTTGGVTTPGSGSVITDFGGIDMPVGVVVQPDGKILVAGTSTDPTNPDHSTFALARYNPDGSVDAGFGNAGMALTTFAAGGVVAADAAQSLLLLADGRILVAGRSNAVARGSDFALARYNPDGSLDPSFGTAGRALTDFLGGDDSANAVALDPRTGNVVAAGAATDPSTGITQFALARYDAAGNLDTSFGSGGKALTSINGKDDEVYGLAINSAGALFATGASSVNVNGVPTSDFATVSYTASGALNRKFAARGILTADLGQPAVANQISLNRDGSILVAGAATASLDAVDPTHLKVVLVQYTAAGRPDTTFGTAGQRILDLAAPSPSIRRAGIVRPFTLTEARKALAALAHQRAIAAALGKLVVVAITGADTAIAQVTPSGSALSNTIATKFPAIVLSGSKGAASVAVLNSGNRAAVGTASITLYASLDMSLDGSDILLTTLPSAKLNLKTGRRKAFKLKFVIPATLGRGNYYLLSRLVPSITGPDVSGVDDVAMTAAPLAIVPPFVDLAGAPLTTPTGLTAGSTAVLPVTIVNNGNVVANGTVVARALAAAGLTPAPTDPTLAMPSLKVRLKPRAAKTYKLKLVVPTSLSPGTYNLLVTLTPSPPNSVGETLAGATALIVN